jgi:hypothetical protein
MIEGPITEGESCLFSCDLAIASFRCIILPYSIRDMDIPARCLGVAFTRLWDWHWTAQSAD